MSAESGSVDDVAAPRSGWRRWLSRRRLSRLLAVGLLAVLALLAGSAAWVQHGSRAHRYSLAEVPAADVALVLGAQVGPDGTPSAFLAARLELARRLFEAGTVRAVLVSGDHGRWSYDEPGGMRRWLVDRGVPAEKVVEDHAGFDTYDSCVRARQIFGVRRAVVVTQTFHLGRAVAVCRAVGLDVAGVGDDSVRRYHAPWTRGVVRERFAAVKAVLDVVTRRDPVFLGDRENGVDRALAGG